MGAGVVGGNVSRARLQAERLADAEPGGVAPGVAVASLPSSGLSGEIVWHQWTIARRAEPQSERSGRPSPADLGPMVAGTGKIQGFHSAAQRVGFQQPAS